MSGYLWASPAQTAFDGLLEKTTSDLLPSSTPPDLLATLQLADLIRSSSIPPAAATKSLLSRLQHANPNVQLLALAVLDICIKNGGTPFLTQVGGSEVSGALEVLARGKPDGNRDVRETVLRKLQDWATAFEMMQGLRGTDLVRSYERLRNEGIAFPPKDPTATAAMVDSLSAPEWDDAPYCTRCRTEFSTFNRKHHCRNCGHVFDQQCSAQSLPLPHYGVVEPVRVCDGCVKKLKDGTGAALARSTSLGAGGSASSRLPERSSTVSYKRSSGRTNSESAINTGKRSKEDDDLERAIAASLLDANPSASSGPAFQLRNPAPTKSDNGYNPSYNNARTTTAAPVSSAPPATEEDDDPDLAAAIAASLRDAPSSAPTSSGTAATYASLYPSSSSAASTYPSLAPQPHQPQPQQYQHAALPSYDLTPHESSTIETFSSTLQRPPPVLGSRERELYEDARRAAPRLERGLEDAERRTEILVEMNDKLGEATRLFEGLLERRVREARAKANEYPATSYAPAPQSASYYPTPVSPNLSRTPFFHLNTPLHTNSTSNNNLSSINLNPNTNPRHLNTSLFRDALTMTTPEQVNTFVELTGATAEQATFFLDSSNGNIETAIEAFFESGGGAPATGGAAVPMDEDDDEDDEEEDEQPVFAAPTTATPAVAQPAATTSWGSGRTLSGATSSSTGPTQSSTSSASSSRSATPSNPFRSNQGPRVSTLRDLNSAAPPPQPRSGGVGRVPHGDDDDDDDPAEFFTGGEKSSLAVENPNAKKGRGATGDMIKGILQKAKEGGSKLAGAATGAPPAQSRSVFSGAAHTLGSDETPSTLIPDPSARPSSSSRGGAVPGGFPGASTGSGSDDNGDDEETVVKNLTFWKNGFSIDDGELMTYEANQEVLAAINSGRAPLSLLKVRHDQPVELRIAKRLDEDWVRQPSAPVGPWGGEGRRLGAEIDAPVSEEAPAVPAAERSSFGQQTVFQVDPDAPTTNLQIRLRDGTRMVARFNHSHTVGDIRNYINASNPGQAATSYALQTTFPSRDLTDDSATLKDANLLGSVVVQRGL
ncbi:hypothetical protein RQP46_000052 [Phenoliferia psychrophenolica]